MLAAVAALSGVAPTCHGLFALVESVEFVPQLFGISRVFWIFREWWWYTPVD
jgi:hypothetical protein